MAATIKLQGLYSAVSQEGSTLSQATRTIEKNWDYADKSIAISRYLLNAIVESGRFIAKGCHKTNRVLKRGVLRLKFVSVVGVMIAVASIPSKINTIWKNIGLHDREGVLLSATAFTVMLSDAFSDTTLLVNATLEALSRETLGWISKLAAPLTIGISGVVAIMKCGHLVQVARFQRELDQILKDVKVADEEEVNAIVSAFTKKHGIIDPDKDDAQNEKAWNVLERHTSKEITNQMYCLSEDSNQSKQQVIAKLEGIQQLLQAEKEFTSGQLLAAVISLIAGVVFLTPAAPVGYVLCAVSAAVQIGISVRYDRKEKSILSEAAAKKEMDLLVAQAN